jgi:SM-20-related protein
MTENSVNAYFESIIDSLVDNKFAIADDFFTTSEVNLLRNNLMRKYDLDQFKKSAIGNTDKIIIEGVRGDFISWIDENNLDTAEQMYFTKVNNFIEYLNSTCYLGIVEGEFHYALYPDGAFYKRHLDVFQNDSRRTLSVIFYLNDDDWKVEDGGELVIYIKDTDGTEKEVNVTPFGGRMVIFNSRELEHEVKIVSRPRKSITGWFKTR